MSTVILNFEEQEIKLLRKKASEANMPLEKYLQEILKEVLETPDDKFETARQFVRTRYKDLYKRLA